MKACKILVTGLVQGIGFRPFVAELAESYNLMGQVKNLGGIVEIMIAGNTQAVDEFIQRLSCAGGYILGVDKEERVCTKNKEQEKYDVDLLRLPGCRIDSLMIEELEEERYKSIICASEGKTEQLFSIVESGNGREEYRFLPVDLPTCDRCVAEMHDKKNRRYRYPFISCTSCGPRFSIQKKVPYDRDAITMDVFSMCEDCKKEYTAKGNIRRHAQTIACEKCGPKLEFLTSRKDMQEILRISDEQQAISEAVKALKEEQIGAIKDIGGYHFAFSPFSSRAAIKLRAFKNRDKKPFAVMFLNLDEVKEYCEVSEKETELLVSDARPIVLLKKKKDFVPEICGESDRIGALLPCNPLQILLLEETGPLVMTSGNRGGEPIIISEEEMLKHLGKGIDFMLTHDREILTPLDDSIYQVSKVENEVGQTIEIPQLIRRARGIVPEVIRLNRKLEKDTFAAGGDLKAAFALGRDELVYMSQYFGDLEDVRCEHSRANGMEHMKELLEIEPECTVGDLHPSYVSTQDTEKKIQHHHAHVASVIAEHGLTGKVLGIACDGTGFGTDGTIWGSEFLLCEEGTMKRCGHLAPVKLVGGDASAKNADMTLCSYMLQARENGLDTEFSFENKLLEMAWSQNINTVYSSSMGRLFDAAAMLLDICGGNSYEGECAISLEQMAHKGKDKLQEYASYKSLGKDKNKVYMNCKKVDGVWQADGIKLLVDLAKNKNAEEKEVLAYRFHHAVATAIVEIAEHICEENEVKQVALSGGTFINRILLKEVMEGLRAKKKEVYINEKVPCGDGGIALGQMYLMTF